jgi:hypothetical protein
MQNFYLDIRKSLLHPWCVVDPKETLAESVERTYQEYQQERSAKLDTLVEILLHHLARDGAPGINPSRHIPTDPPEQQQQQEQQEPPQGQEQAGAQSKTLPPDKIIVYSYFPSAFGLIKMVSNHQRSELQHN